MRTLITAIVLFAVTLPAPSEAAPPLRAALRKAQRDATAVITRGLDRIKATPAQRRKIREHLAQSALDLWGLRVEAARLQDSIAAGVLAEKQDEAELDRLETEGIDLITRGSRIVRVGLVQSAAVLTPEQRQALLEFWRQWLRQAAGV